MGYIVTREEHSELNHDKTKEWLTPKTALFYFKPIGKRRLYRRPFEEDSEEFILYVFNDRKDAEKELIHLNNKMNHDIKWKIEEV